MIQSSLYKKIYTNSKNNGWDFILNKDKMVKAEAIDGIFAKHKGVSLIFDMPLFIDFKSRQSLLLKRVLVLLSLSVLFVTFVCLLFLIFNSF